MEIFKKYTIENYKLTELVKKIGSTTEMLYTEKKGKKDIFFSPTM